MASQKQIDANRRNARKSTGPVTEAGKAVAKFNALRHGMTADTAVLPFEDHLAYALLREGLMEHYAPANIAEQLLVDVIANSYWRLLRARRVETSTIKLGLQALKQRSGLNPAPNPNDDDALAVFFTDENDNLRNQERYHGTIERSYFRAVEQLRKAQNDRLCEERRTIAARKENGFVSPDPLTTVIDPDDDPTYAPPTVSFLPPWPGQPDPDAAEFGFVPSDAPNTPEAEVGSQPKEPIHEPSR